VPGQRHHAEAYLEQDLLLRDLSAVAGLSHFARAFKRSVGSSPHRYVLRRALSAPNTISPQASCRWLPWRWPCGFGSQSHFTARFRAATGLTPASVLELQGELLAFVPFRHRHDAALIICATWLACRGTLDDLRGGAGRPGSNREPDHSPGVLDEFFNRRLKRHFRVAVILPGGLALASNRSA
jgi:AraC-like DNA-binding protein